VSAVGVAVVVAAVALMRMRPARLVEMQTLRLRAQERLEEEAQALRVVDAAAAVAPEPVTRIRLTSGSGHLSRCRRSMRVARVRSMPMAWPR
jgi:hypothetical protein